MQKRCISNTGIDVSIIGLGTVKFGRNQGVKYPASFDIPTGKEIQHLLAIASDLGINLLDTAPAYGTSEERLGKLIANERHQWVITTKVGEEFVNGVSSFDFSKKSVKQSVERSLKRLQTDYLDIVLVHSDGRDQAIIQHDSIFATLAELKTEGKIRAFGMSTKTIEGGMLTIDHADIAMVSFNSSYTDEKKVIEYAHQSQKGIFIKKALASGHLQMLSATDPITDSMRFIFAQPGVTSVIVGTINPLHLRENVEKALSVL